KLSVKVDGESIALNDENELSLIEKELTLGMLPTGLAGSGLESNEDGSLSVKTDGTSITLKDNLLSIKDVDPLLISESLVGNGLSRDGSGTLSVKTDGTSISL